MGRGSGQPGAFAGAGVLFGRQARGRKPDRAAPIKVEIEPGSLDEYCECLVDGYTPQTFSRILPGLGEKLGLDLIAIWEDRDELGLYGEVEIYAIDQRAKLRELPPRLEEWLFVVEPRPLPTRLTFARSPRRLRNYYWEEVVSCNGLLHEKSRWHEQSAPEPSPSETM